MTSCDARGRGLLALFSLKIGKSTEYREYDMMCMGTCVRLRRRHVSWDFFSISRETSSSGENERHFVRVRVAREELYFLLIHHMLIRYRSIVLAYIYSEKSRFCPFIYVI